MTRLGRYNLYLIGSVAALAWGHAALAADLTSPVPAIEQTQTDTLPAVSGVNGKWELNTGYLNDPSSAVFSAAGSLSIPLGERFGLQGDASVSLIGDDVTYGAALHAFTRDPSSYLFGVTAGVVVAPNAVLSAIGPEAELYMDRFSIEAWAGYANVDYDVGPSDSGAFGMADLVFYPTDDWRLSVGGSYVLGETALHIGTEYQLSGLGMPVSLTADGRFGTSGDITATIGIKGYFGGNDSQKSLIDRQRQDDPRNRAVDLFSAAGSVLVDPGAGEPPPPPDPEQVCITAEGHNIDWWNGESCEDPEPV